MGANITIGGIVNRMRRMKNPNNRRGQDFDWVCLDIETGGVAPPPKGLPKVKPITYTCVLNDKQFKTLSQEMEEYALRRIKGRYVVVQGELTLDLPFEVLDKNEIGVITYRIKSKEVEYIQQQLNTDQSLYIPVDSIMVPESMVIDVDQEELDASIDFYQKKVKFKDTIGVYKDKKTDSWHLHSGYLSYLASKKLKLDKVLAVQIEK